MITEVKFVSVPTRDQDAALEFWTEKVGLAVATDQPFDEHQRWIELRLPGGSTCLVLFTAPGQEDRVGSMMNLAFSVSDIETTHRQMSARGVEFVQEPKKESWGTSALFRDPDGNVFCLSST